MPQEIRGSQPTKTHTALSVLDVEENALIPSFFPSFLSSYTVKLLKTQTLLRWYSEPMFSHKWKTKTKTDIYIFPSRGKNCKCCSSILEICLSNDWEISIFYFFLSLILHFIITIVLVGMHVYTQAEMPDDTLLESFLSFFLPSLHGACLLSHFPWPLFFLLPIFFKLITKLFLLSEHKKLIIRRSFIKRHQYPIAKICLK